MAGKNITEEQRSLGALLRLPYQKLLDHTYSQLATTGFADMAYLVNSLEESGYVQLDCDPTDGRAKIVRLTKRGVAFQQAALRSSQKFEAELSAVVGQAEMIQLRGLLEKVVDQINALDDKSSL